MTPPQTILPSLHLENSAFVEVKVKAKAKKKTDSLSLPPPPSLCLYTNIETDKKKKKLSISSADRVIDKNKKKTKMSSSDKVRASHILIKHQGSRRKASWKDPDGRVISATTRDSAVSQLKSLRDDIVNGKAKFDDIASRFSDCSSAKRGGDLGSFGRGQMQKPFEEATYALKIGEISDMVHTDSGVHIIMRTG
ncbi:Peptidyl-prolyl cis-trans isomerase, PpiC-type [Dillenia turbinata]|uniref:Peptidyl-prolyl cis-trans isomerase n=1 Tax=Dillenia turbinata TaxID=194707 RepID=A0AAN8Z2V5_9MAGN